MVLLFMALSMAKQPSLLVILYLAVIDMRNSAIFVLLRPTQGRGSPWEIVKWLKAAPRKFATMPSRDSSFSQL